MCEAGRRCWRWIVCCDRKLPDVGGTVRDTERVMKRVLTILLRIEKERL